MLGRKFPKRIACDFDFPGYQTGRLDRNAEVKKVFLCLDFTEDCLDECLRYQPDLILTHHPFFFGKKDEVLRHDPLKKELDDKINSLLHCPIYSYHTNFDIAEGGMNDTILSLLGMKRQRIASDGLMRIARLDEETDISQIIDRLLSLFSFEYVGYLSSGKPIRTIGLIAGGGGNDFMTAIEEKVDLFISGDCAHHARVDMRRYGLQYIELPHECEELGFLQGMSNAVKEIDSDLDIHPYSFEKYFSLRTNGNER